MKEFVETRRYIDELKTFEKDKINRLGTLCDGVLQSMRGDIEVGLLDSVERLVAGEIFADFLATAKAAIDDEAKDVGAVLANAAFEDTLKKIGSLNGLEVEEKDLSETINALKSSSILKGPQTKIASSYVRLRNKAFHAEWDNIDVPEVKSLIALTEELVIRHLSEQV